MSKVMRKNWARLFGVAAVLIIAQVLWWAAVFVRDVNTISELRFENSLLKAKIGEAPESEASIERSAFHRRLMFLSESVFFEFVACLGLYLLYRSLKEQEKSREIQRNFIETVTHESKTPLTALKLRLESISEKQSDPILTTELEASLEEVRRLSSIFEKTLNLNRLERYEYRFEKVVLSDIIQEVVRRLEPFLKSRQVDLKVDLDPEVWVKGDSDGLQNSVQSLLENAVLYNDKGEKQVTLELKREDSEARLRISDNGPGISEIDGERIFEKFYRGKSGRRVPGTGLGLYLAKCIVEAHRGVLRLIESKSGTRFEIRLPTIQGAS